MKWPQKVVTLGLLTLAGSMIAACGGVDEIPTTVRNNLFEQPGENDNTCGVRQTLLAQKVLGGSTDYFDDILSMWKRINSDARENYPQGLPRENPIDEYSERFVTAPLPSVYAEAELAAVEGGPETLPSSILKVLREDGYVFERYYLDEPAVTSIFGADLLRNELESFVQIFPEVEREDVDIASKTDMQLRAMLTNPGSYYITIVNDGDHWIGVTPDAVFDSLAAEPKAVDSDFGFEFGNPEAPLNSFTGLVLEIRGAP